MPKLTVMNFHNMIVDGISGAVRLPGAVLTFPRSSTGPKPKKAWNMYRLIASEVRHPLGEAYSVEYKWKKRLRYLPERSARAAD